MSVVSIAEAWPATSRPFTVTDLDRMPDDGRRYELIDGVLIVSPGPAIPHQEAVGELNFLLRQVPAPWIPGAPGPHHACLGADRTAARPGRGQV